MPRLFHNGTPRITCDHPCHLRRASRGGEDFAVPERTPLYAPVSGTYRFRWGGTGGYTITVIPADARLRGLVLECMHLHSSAGLALNGSARYYREGELIGYSGGRVGHPGAGSSTGPHTHEHGNRAGRRMGIREAIAWANAVIRPTPPPPPQTKKGHTMKLIKRVNAGPVEASLISPELVGATPLEQGYVVITDEAQIAELERQYADGYGSADTLGAEPGKSNRDAYMRQQATARWVRLQWLRGQPTASGKPTDLSAVLDAIAKAQASIDDLADDVPTAEENAAAARRAIVAD